ncbi:MAG: hypothetical protein ACRELV_12500 [Longimicrobiales bacterium]
MYRTTTCTLAAIAVLAATASPAFAQACLGVPAGSGQYALGPTASFMDGAKSYGADVQANLSGPFSVGGGYALTDSDLEDAPNGHTLAATVSYELPIAQVSVCPSVGVSYGWVSFEDDSKVSNTTIPVGIGFGKSFAASESLDVTPYAVPQFMHMRPSVTGVEDLDSVNEFAGTLGLQLGMNRIYGGGGVSMTTIEESEPVYFVRLGFILP